MGPIDLFVTVALGGQVWVSAPAAWVHAAVDGVRAVVALWAAVG